MFSFDAERQMNSISKAELKLALINKTLPLLQEDDDNEDDNINNAQINPVSVKSPILSQSDESDDESEEDEKLQVFLQHAKQQRSKRKRKRRIEITEPSDDDDTSTPVMKRALDIQANLTTEHPSFVKLMLPSHVSRVFWLHLPAGFCRDHLPKCDSIMELVGEDGKRTKCNYLLRKYGLSDGWRAFSLEHEIKEGDVVVFQLINLTTFKVYIARKDNPDESEAALGLQTPDDCKEQEILGNSENNNNPPCNSESPINNTNHLECEVLDGIRFSNTTITFDSIRSFKKFTIIVDDLIIDSKFSEANRKKYYKLCRSQKSFLHENLLKGLNISLVIGIILETINISDGINACTSSTSTDELQKWVKTLEGFEVLGMNVKFLRDKLMKMSGIAVGASPVEKMKDLDRKLSKLKAIMEKINLEMEA